MPLPSNMLPLFFNFNLFMIKVNQNMAFIFKPFLSSSLSPIFTISASSFPLFALPVSPFPYCYFISLPIPLYLLCQSSVPQQQSLIIKRIDILDPLLPRI